MDDELKAKVIDHYQKGEGSIQDIARVYRLTVEEVLEVLDMKDLTVVESVGDLIGQEEAGMDVTINPSHKFKVPFSTD